MKKNYKIEVDCANCANRMEEVVKNFKGVKNAAVNFMTQKMTIDFDEEVDNKKLIHEIREECQKIDDDCDIII